MVTKEGDSSADTPAQTPASSSAPARRRGPGGRFVAQAGSSAMEASAAPAVAAPRSIDLLLVRHADAGDAALWAGEDALRPLSKKGRRHARRLGDLLADVGVRPEAILTSPRVRAADTAKLVGKRVGCKAVVDERLDAGFDLARLAAVLADHGKDGSVMLVGHDPDFSSIASSLVDAPLSMAKGALVRIELPDGTAAAGRGILRWLLPPDALPR